MRFIGLIFSCIATLVLATQAGGVSKALSLGVKGWVEIPDHPSLNFGTSGLTVSAWIKTVTLTTSRTGRDDIVAKGDPTISGYAISLENDKAVFWINESGELFGTTVLNDGKWHHITGTRDDFNNTVLYVDGIAESGGTNNENVDTGYSLFIGKHGTKNESYFDGIIDEVRIWNRALTAEEIQANMNRSLSNNEEGLVGYWKFDELYTERLIPDLSGNDNHGTLVGDAKLVAGVLPGDFDGDEEVGFGDFFLFADAFGSTDWQCDLNGSGQVDFDDFFLFSDNFGKKVEGTQPVDETPCIPSLISPENDAQLDNGRLDGLDDMVWEFDWSDCSSATQYHLYVIGPSATIPVINDENILNSCYTLRDRGYVDTDRYQFGWTWKARAKVAGQWGEWSEVRQFSIEPVGSDMATVTIDLPGEVTMEFVWIVPGRFMMGSPDSDVMAFEQEKPQHQVTISRGFWLGKYELTQAQWEAVMGTRPWSGKDNVQENANHPAVYISWEDVQAFIGKLNEVAGEEIYRLPTEAEWEYACRAWTKTQWSFGDDESQLMDYAWYYDDAWNIGERYGYVVGMKKPNPWGLFDMHGNVWEWVQDRYGSYSSSAQRDPTGPTAGSGPVIRGGFFSGTARGVRSAVRYYGAQVDRNGSLGARLLRIKGSE